MQGAKVKMKILGWKEIYLIKAKNYGAIRLGIFPQTLFKKKTPLKAFTHKEV